MPLELEGLTFSALSDLPKNQTIFVIPVAPLGGSEEKSVFGSHLSQAHELAEAVAAKIEADLPGWKAILWPSIPIGAGSSKFSLQSRGYVLRDYLVDSCEPLIGKGFSYFLCVSLYPSPRHLTAIEEAGKVLKSRYRWRLYSRFIKRDDRLRMPALMSAGSPLTDWKRALKSPFKMNEEAFATRERKDQVNEIVTKFRAVTSGSEPATVFRSWYSAFPPNSTFFKAWVLSALFVTLMLVWIALTLPGFDQI